MAKTAEQLKQLSIEEFTEAAQIYESGHAGIYEICKDDYPHPEKFFSEAARVLRPGGRLILRDYTSNDFMVWLMNNIELRALAEGAGLTVLKLEAQKGFRAHLVARKE